MLHLTINELVDTTKMFLSTQKFKELLMSEFQIDKLEVEFGVHGQVSVAAGNYYISCEQIIKANTHCTVHYTNAYFSYYSVEYFYSSSRMFEEY